jgi:hypothetical protein
MNTMKKRGRPKKVVETELEPQAEPEQVKTNETFEIRVIRQMPNPRWVAGDLNGELIKIAISPKFTNKLVGRTIKVGRIQRDLIEQFEHIP